jgi:hypothetical protein
MGPGLYPLYAPSGVLQHPQLGACSYSLASVSDDPDTQVEQVVGMMSQYAGADSKSKVIAGDAAAARHTGEPCTDTWNYLARHGGSRGMTFQRDEITGAPVEKILPVWQPIVEALIRPVDQALLPRPIGDCDDFAMYGAAHLLSAGVPCSFVTVAADDNQPGMYSHVYLVAYPKSGQYAGRRVPMDLSHGDFLGWEYSNPTRKREWPVATGVSFLSLALGAAGAYLLYKVATGGMN